MDRLTWEYKDGGMFVDETDIKTFECDDVLMYTGNAIIKLAKYEDTGVSPEEINDLKDAIDLFYRDFPTNIAKATDMMPPVFFSVKR